MFDGESELMRRIAGVVGHDESKIQSAGRKGVRRQASKLEINELLYGSKKCQIEND